MRGPTDTRYPPSRHWRRAAKFALGSAFALSLGCGHTWPWAKKAEEPPGYAAGSGALADPSPALKNGELAAAQDSFKGDNFKIAQVKYHEIADDNRTSPRLAEEARYYEAESYYKAGDFPKAADTYHKQVIDFPRGAYASAAAQRMFEIANFWLDDTRAEMEKVRATGSAGFNMPISVSFDPKKPLFDTEGRAVQLLDWVHLADISGPYADKALFLAGNVKFFRQEYREADHYFQQIMDFHKNSPLVQETIEKQVLAKSLCVGGPEYDGRKLAEARQLIEGASKSYPELRQKDPGFLDRQLAAVHLQQAAKEYENAQFYERTKKPMSAIFSYAIMVRRYPGTKYAQLAAERQSVLEAEVKANPPKQEPPGGFFERLLPNLGIGSTTMEQPKEKPPVVPAGPAPERAPAPRPLPPGLTGP